MYFTDAMAADRMRSQVNFGEERGDEVAGLVAPPRPGVATTIPAKLSAIGNMHIDGQISVGGQRS
jgi:hypothetical protein